MSDDEKNKLKEYELKLLKMNEEKEKYKKNLGNLYNISGYVYIGLKSLMRYLNLIQISKSRFKK
jgi:hypothetical protein